MCIVCHFLKYNVLRTDTGCHFIFVNVLHAVYCASVGREPAEKNLCLLDRYMMIMW